MPNWKKIIVSGSDASLSSAYIEGNLTASAAYLTSASIGHLETIYETASVIYSSGSTKFGDTSDDTHERTGSVDISGSLIVDGVSSLSKVEINTTTTGDSLLITSTEDSSNAAPVITLKRNSSSPADSDYIGQIKFKGENDADQEIIYAKITGKIKDASDGSEDGNIEFANKRGGLNVITARLSSDKLHLLNGTDLDVDGDVTADNFTGTASIADFATTASHALNVPDTASHALTAITASHTAGTASISNFATSASFAITASYIIGGAGNSGSFSGSFQGDGSALSGITVAQSTLASASFLNVTSYTASHNLESTELTVAVYDNSNNQVIPETIRILNDANVGLDFSEATTGKVVLTKGGHIVSGSIPVSEIATVTASFTSVTSTTASHDFGTKNIIVTAYTDNDEQIIPSVVRTLDDNNVGADFATTTTGRLVIAKGGHIVTGSRTIITDYNLVTASTYEDTFTAVTSHTASHNFGTKNVFVQIYDSSDNVIVPSNIKTNTVNEVGIDFASTRTGRVIVGKSGHLVSASYNTTTASFAETASFYGGSVISASFSETASYGNSFTASNLYVEGTASITYLESVYETSSVIYSSGSTKFGDDTSDTHEITGSLEVSGSANLVASQSVNNNTSSGSLSFWNGSQTEYDALGSYDNNTIYFVVA